MLVHAALTSDLLMAKEESDLAYINRMNEVKEAKEAFLQANPDAATFAGVGAVKNVNRANTADQTSQSPLEQVKEAVLKGKQRDILSLTRKAVEEHIEPQDILNQALLPAIGEVGDLFDCGKYFLPQLIASAETMKKAIEYLECFPERTNVTFAQLIDKSNIKIREWERGTGETLGCGTGCCSAVVIAHRLEKCDRSVRVEQPGGTLDVLWDDDGNVHMIGPSHVVCEGEYSYDIK